MRNTNVYQNDVQSNIEFEKFLDIVVMTSLRGEQGGKNQGKEKVNIYIMVRLWGYYICLICDYLFC